MNHRLIMWIWGAVGTLSLAGGCAGPDGDSASAAANEMPSQSVEANLEETAGACSGWMGRDFEATLQRHVKAVSERDLPTLEATLTRGESLTLIFPSGTRFETRREFVDFHREWFASTTWTMSMTPERTLCSPGMALALMRTHYEDIDDEGKRYFSENYLTLTFALERGTWRLVHDQNTRIRTGPLPQ